MRYPAVAGSFYPAEKQALESDIKRYLENVSTPKTPLKNPVSLISPHAGLIYSGQVAAFGFAKLANVPEKRPTFVLIGPNHTGAGSGLSLSTQDWSTPLGITKNDMALGKEIQKNSNFLDIEEQAHANEHSLEVQLPFIQYLFPHAEIVPICMLIQDLDMVHDLANAIFKANQKLKKKVIVLASSDLTHYESANIATIKDMIAINAIKMLDPDKLMTFVKNKGLTLCGYAPIAVALAYSRLKKAKKCEILKHANSGDVTHDYRSVVGYVSAIISK